MIVLSLEEYNSLPSDYSRLKYVYEYCVDNKWEKSKLDVLAKSLHVLVPTIASRGKRFAGNYLYMTEEEISNFRAPYRNGRSDTKYNMLLNKIFELNDKKQITELIQSGDYVLSDIRSKIPSYVRLYKSYLSKEEQEKVVEELKEKVIPYNNDELIETRKRIMKEKALMKKLEWLKNTFEMIVSGELKECDIEIYRTNRNFEYKKDLEVLREYLPELYSEYMKLKDQEKKKDKLRYNYVIDEVKKVLYYLVVGVEDEGIIRKFDIIDFYDYFDITVEELNAVVVNSDIFSYDDICLVKGFLHSYVDNAKIMSDRMVDIVLGKYEEINCKKNKNGMPILGTGIVIPREDKIRMVEYLKEKNYPITDKNYFALLIRYKNKILSVGKGKTKNLNRKNNENV